MEGNTAYLTSVFQLQFYGTVQNEAQHCPNGLGLHGHRDQGDRHPRAGYVAYLGRCIRTNGPLTKGDLEARSSLNGVPSVMGKSIILARLLDVCLYCVSFIAVFRVTRRRRRIEDRLASCNNTKWMGYVRVAFAYLADQYTDLDCHNL